MSNIKNPTNILIFRGGQLGDTLAAVPALWVLRDLYPNAHITLLYDNHVNENHVSPRQVLEGSGLIDSFVHYNVYASSKICSYIQYAILYFKLLKNKFDMLAYLPGSGKIDFLVNRDLKFFRLLGISNIVGHIGLRGSLYIENYHEPITLENESGHLLTRLSKSEIPIPSKGLLRSDLNLREDELKFAKNWINGHSASKGKILVALGIGSKFDEKKWATENYISIVKNLIEKFDICPIIFGGKEDLGLAKEVIKDWKRGLIGAGKFNIRESASLMNYCSLYLGNDTGTMHLASSEGVPCVSIFSGRDFPGAWYPFGDNHQEFRVPYSCEDIPNGKCTNCSGLCLESINQDEVLEACIKLISNKLN